MSQNRKPAVPRSQKRRKPMPHVPTYVMPQESLVEAFGDNGYPTSNETCSNPDCNLDVEVDKTKVTRQGQFTCPYCHHANLLCSCCRGTEDGGCDTCTIEKPNFRYWS